MRQRSRVCLIVIVWATSLLIAHPLWAVDTFRRSWPVMGTYAEFTSAHDSEGLNRRAEQAVRDVFDRINRTMSTYDPQSDISQLNRRSGNVSVKVDPWVKDLLQKGKRAAEVTGGAFSMDVLGYGVKLGLKPGGDSYALPPHGDRFIDLSPSDNDVMLKRSRMGLDLGGIAKGYALGRAVERLREMEMNRFLLSLGRAVYAGEPPTGQSGWPVKLYKGATNSYHDQFISVSEQGIRSDTGHIIDPRAGEPVDSARRVIVVSRKGWPADMASTALMVDPTLRPRLLKHYPALVRLMIIE